jgi:hypothetical protein
MIYSTGMSFDQVKKELVKKRKIITAVIVVLLLIIILMFAIVASSRPTRSVTAFCSTYKQEDARLAKSSGDTYSLHPFTHDSNNPHDFVIALSNLDAVAPKDIEPDVKTLKLLFEKIDKDPSQAMSASLSGLGAESNVSDWATQHCQ